VNFYDQWAAPEPKPTGGPTAAPGTATAYATAALQRELDALATATPGYRNHQLNRSAFNLAQLVRSGHLNELLTMSALRETAIAIGLTDHETRATLASAFRAAPPRDVPEQETAPDATVYTPDRSEKVAPDEEDAGPLLDRHLIDWAELWEQDDEEEWIVEPILPARRLVALFSAPKVGKSLLLLELAVAIARGEPVLGTTIDRPRRVAYVDYENDPRGDVRARLVAMNRKPDALENLLYLSFPSMPGMDTAAGAAHLLDFCARHAVEVVVIDTVSRAVDGEENENDTWLSFYKRTGLALKQNGISCIRLDHTGKDATKGMRGGSAKYGDVDAVWSMTAVSETTFKLQCTANRMPIGEKILVLERQADPLRHTVRGNVGAALASARHGQIIADIDELYGVETRVGARTDVTFNAVQKALRSEGKGVRRETLADALDERNLRFGITTFTYAEEDE
jgi:hypothetical protein